MWHIARQFDKSGEENTHRYSAGIINSFRHFSPEIDLISPAKNVSEGLVRHKSLSESDLPKSFGSFSSSDIEERYVLLYFSFVNCSIG